MAFRGTTVRGTPINRTNVAGNSGIRPGVPKGMVGTVHKQYDSDRRGYQSDPNGGTPYHSQAGNPPEARQLVTRDARGRVLDPNMGEVPNDPSSNGTGVVFDGTDNMGDGNSPRIEPTMDSPVPREAPVFDPGFMVQENRQHLGHGKGPTAPNDAMSRDEILPIGGVMSRGMIGTSHADDTDERELIQDDRLVDSGKVDSDL
jgi:hypothetical protein